MCAVEGVPAVSGVEGGEGRDGQGEEGEEEYVDQEEGPDEAVLDLVQRCEGSVILTDLQVKILPRS